MPATDAASSTSPEAGSENAALKRVTTEEFVRAFDKQRTTLAGFSRCSNLQELRIVRDGFYLGLAKDLCPDAYKAVLVLVLRKKFGGGDGTNEADGSCDAKRNNDDGTLVVEEGDQGILSMSFEEMVTAARICDEPSTPPSNDEKQAGGTNEKPGDATATTTATITAEATTSRATTYWKDLVETVLIIGASVGSDLGSIWKTLEDGRLNWLRAVSTAHPIKKLLKKALEDDGALDSAGDVSDAMMVWIYSICLALSESAKNKDNDQEQKEPDDHAAAMVTAVDRWVIAVNMIDRCNPLKGYRPELWDPRREEWRALDFGAQEAAERGGANLLEAWNA